MSKIIPNAPEGDNFSQFYDDAVAFVTYAMLTKTINPPMIVNTLMHDIGGIIRKERGFCPRVSGYAKDLAKLRERMAREDAAKDAAHTCPKCGSSWGVHNGDGSCVKG